MPARQKTTGTWNVIAFQSGLCFNKPPLTENMKCGRIIVQVKLNITGNVKC